LATSQLFAISFDLKLAGGRFAISPLRLSREPDTTMFSLDRSLMAVMKFLTAGLTFLKSYVGIPPSTLGDPTKPGYSDPLSVFPMAKIALTPSSLISAPPEIVYASKKPPFKYKYSE